MTPRKAVLDDVPMLARLHVEAWKETYTGLLPEREIAARGLDQRHRIWTQILERQIGRVWLFENLGFAHFGMQREDEWREKGYIEELFSMYLIKQGYGRGRPLIEAAFGSDGKPFTACVLDENARACAFYEKAGGVHLTTRTELVGQSPTVERVYGWTAPPFAPQPIS